MRVDVRSGYGHVVTLVAVPHADLPGLPEEIERWIADVQGNPDAHAAQLLRRAASRFARIRTWDRERDGDLHDWTVEYARTHVVEFGPVDLGLDSPGCERAIWRCTLPIEDEEIVLTGTSPQDLIDASWKLTFKAAHMMLQATSTAPRLMQEVGGVYKTAMTVHQEGLQASDAQTIAHIRAESSDKKQDRILMVLKEMLGGKDETAQKALKEASTTDSSRKLLSSLEPDDLVAVLAHPLGRVIATATKWGELTGAVESLWDAHSKGEISLSKASLDAARVVVRGFNA